jgi:CHAT domain-containing protein
MAILCSFAPGCPTHTDTTARKEWPRFSVRPDWNAPHADMQCPVIGSRNQAVRLLPVCMDKAIAALKRFADRDNVAISDLAAAYYVRAATQDKPEDYLNAYDAAEHAVNTTPRPEWAEGNLAVIKKALGLKDIEIAAFRPDDPQSVARYPASAQRYLEEELLPRNVAKGRVLATQLARITGDRFSIDEVNACVTGNPEELKNGYADLAKIRTVLIPDDPEVAVLCKRTEEELRRGGSPAFLYASAALAFGKRDFATLDVLETEAQKRQYSTLAAWVVSARGYLLWDAGRYIESLRQYDAALALYESLHDPESATSTHVRRVGVLRVAGQLDAAWREGLEARRNLSEIVSLKERNLLLGEIAAVALALQHPRPAFLYADQIVRLLQSELQSTSPDRVTAINRLQNGLAVALRRRARYELGNKQYEAADRDLAEATRLARKNSFPEFRRSLEVRSAEVDAQSLMHVDVALATEAFTKALALAKGLEYRSLRASLLAQRAEAHRRAGDHDGEEQDLRASLVELNAEETDLLARRTAEEDERILWSDYFSRFEETYHELIRHLIDTNRGAEAFKYADRARAFEPLNLALKLTPTAAAPVDMAQVQKLLPRGTFLIEYTVLDDMTFAWVITHDRREVVKLKTGRSKIRRWSSELQAGVKARDLTAIETVLFAAYDELLTEPMAVIQQMPDSAAPRLVIIPDGTMEAIPFAALRNPVSRRYLIQDAPVSMAGSAALYALSVKRDRELKRDGSALLFGLLRHAEEEVQRIAKTYAPNAIVRTGAEATAEDFIARAGQSAIVHVGAHAIVDTHAPSHSKLIFASSELDASQLLARFKPVRTRLVVLGACSSAGGLPLGPEGVAPLVRPLIARGVPAVVGTLWDVEDATAKELLVSFHQHYQEGNDAAVAMRLAQIELLNSNNDGLRSVLAWAPYQVIGYGSSPFPAPRR